MFACSCPPKDCCHRRRLAVAVCSLATAAAYNQRIDTFFFQDDLAMVAHGVQCWRHHDLYRLLSTDQYDIVGFNRLRPVVLSLFTLLYHLFGLHAVAFRLINISAHCASGAMVFWLAHRIVRFRTACLAAVLFLTWPSLSNAVFPVCTMTDTLAGFFLLAATCTMVRAANAQTLRRRLLGLLAAGSLYLCGQLSKETAIGTSAFMVIATHFVGRRTWRASLAFTSPIAALSACYLLWRRFVFGVFLADARITFGATDWRSWLAKYVQFWFEFATQLNLDDVKVIVTPRVVPLLIAVLLLFSIGVVVAVGVSVSRNGASPLTRFGLCLFFVTLMPVLYYPSSRNLYVPAMGLSMALAAGAEHLWQRARNVPRAQYALLALLLCLGTYRLAIVNLHCRNNGRAGDLFETLVTELDHLSQRAPGPTPEVYLFATPIELVTPLLVDTPWLFCGGDAGYYQELKYGERRATFHYPFGVSLKGAPLVPPAIALTQPAPGVLEIALDPRADFHWLADPRLPTPVGRVDVLAQRRPYRLDVPSRIRVHLADSVVRSQAVMAVFDGSHAVPFKRR